MSEPNLSKGFCGEVLSVHFWKLEQREKSGRGWLPASRVGGCGHLRPSQSAAGCHHKRTQGRIFWEEMAQHKIDQQVFGWPPSSQDDNFLNISDCLHSEGYYPFFICIRKKIYKKNDKTWYFFVKCLHLCCFSSFVPFLSFFVTYFVSCFFLCFTSIVHWILFFAPSLLAVFVNHPITMYHDPIANASNFSSSGMGYF